MYLLAIAAAEHSIDLEAAYFIPDELISKALVAARKRGVKIRVLLPGENTDSDAARMASKAAWGPLLQAGVEIYEYNPTMFHNKMLIVDHLLVSVGSTNFDLRSFQLNDEASLNVYNPTFAAAMTEVFERDIKPTTRYTYETWARRGWKEKFEEKFIQPIKSQL
jgi:cardiolipin synthase